MRINRGMIVGFLLLAAATVVRAQDTRPAESEVSAMDRILGLLSLPATAERTRESGVAVEDVRVILEETRRRELPPQETMEILDEAESAARENGPVDNFGAFVQARLADGLRGRDLAAAIRAEHVAHGRGKAKPKLNAHGEEQGDDMPGGEHGRQDESKKKGKGNG